VALSYDEIAEILKIIDGSSCDELVVDTGDMKLVVRRNSAGGAYVPQDDRPAVAPPPAAPVTPPAQPGNRPRASATTTDKTTDKTADKTAAKIAATGRHQAEVVAPMVGTFYRAPAPDAPAFVEIGDAVRKGQPLCLIEVMKLFTTIASEHDGRIVAIGAENGELVEYGRTLFVIEPA
jgi:acetyl-CoA carboxylase biotin carboxyl carrier protein